MCVSCLIYEGTAVHKTSVCHVSWLLVKELEENLSKQSHYSIANSKD